MEKLIQDTPLGSNDTMEPRELNNRQSYVGNEGCFGGCILTILLLPFMIAVAPFVWVYRIVKGEFIP